MSLPVDLRDTSGGECQLVVVQDHPHPCPYLDGQTARLPLCMPIGKVSAEHTDQMLERGFRRSGEYVYRAQCPDCQECKPTRVEVCRFRLSKSFRRVMSRGDRELRIEWGKPIVDSAHVKMFNDHRRVRGLSIDRDEADFLEYSAFLQQTCCETSELSIYLGEMLVGVSIVDLGATSLSAVYTHFDPLASRYSPGTYAVLKHMQYAMDTNRRYVYLGMYVADNRHLNYKARFKPQQRLIDGSWTEIDV